MAKNKFQFNTPMAHFWHVYFCKDGSAIGTVEAPVTSGRIHMPGPLILSGGTKNVAWVEEADGVPVSYHEGIWTKFCEVPRSGLSHNANVVDGVNIYRVNESNTGYVKSDILTLTVDHETTLNADSDNGQLAMIAFGLEEEPEVADEAEITAGTLNVNLRGWFLLRGFYEGEEIKAIKAYGEASLSGAVDFMGNKNVEPKIIIKWLSAAHKATVFDPFAVTAD